MLSPSLQKKFSLSLLILLITLVHLWVLSLDFEWPKRTSTKKLGYGSSVISADLWGDTRAFESNPNEVSEQPNEKSVTTEKIGASKVASGNQRAFIINNSEPSEKIDAFHLSQKIRQQLLRNENIARFSSAQSALVDLRKVLFRHQENDPELNCCQVAFSSDSAYCTNPQTTEFYKTVVDSLRSRLEAISRQGINTICNRE